MKELLSILKVGGNDYSKVPGLWHRDNGNIKNNTRAELINNLDEGLPIAAWDLLPMGKYRAHNWHCFDDIDNRMPYGALYTSLGCPYACVFCCINAPFVEAGNKIQKSKLVVKKLDY